MKYAAQNSERRSINRDTFSEWLASWRQRLGFVSIFAALPAVAASQAAEARVQDTEQSPVDLAARQARIIERWKSYNTKPDFLRRQSDFSLPRQKGNLELVDKLTGNDNCPGSAIPPGTFTPAAPFTDTGDTAGANNTVNELPYYGYYYQYSYSVTGPDLVYSFTLISHDASPEIRVTPTSSTYDPAIFVLDGRYAPGCPSGTRSAPWNWRGYRDLSGPGGAETLSLDEMPLNVPLYLFIDSNGTSGTYTLRMQDVTIAAAPRTRFDFDGDGRADISLFRPSNRVWYLNRSSQGFAAAEFGLPTDAITPADFDGDGKTDISVYRDGTWWRINSSDGTVGVNQFGIAGDIPVPADYNGDGRAELAVYRNGVWWFLDLANDQYKLIQFGLPTERPIPADFDGDGKTDLALFRPSASPTWSIWRSHTNTIESFQTYRPNSVPVVGDYDGDGMAEAQYIFPYQGGWYWSVGATAGHWGLATDTPVPADYDGDGRTDIAIYRNGQWWLLQSTAGIAVTQFGLANDKPVPAPFN